MSILEQISSITLQNLKISFSEAGKGESILCLHGNPSNRNIFSNLMKKLDGLNIRLLAPDRPGHNSTDELPWDEKDLWYDTSIYAELIEKKLGNKAWLLGHGYGCLTAIKTAIKYPEKTKGLLLINPTVALDNQKEKISSIPHYAKGAFIGSILGIFLPNQYNDYFGNILKKVYLPEKPEDEYVDSLLQKFTRFENIISYITDKNIQIRIQNELKEEMKKISLSTYALFGANDGFSNVQEQKEILSLIPNIKIETLENKGHYLPYLNPDDCAEFIKKSLK